MKFFSKLSIFLKVDVRRFVRSNYLSILINFKNDASFLRKSENKSNRNYFRDFAITLLMKTIIFIFIINSDFHFSICFLMISIILSNTISKKLFINCVICEALICFNFIIIIIFSNVHLFFSSFFLLHLILKCYSNFHILNSLNFWTSTKWDHFNVLTTCRLINTSILKSLMLFFMIIHRQIEKTVREIKVFEVFNLIRSWFRSLIAIHFFQRIFDLTKSIILMCEKCTNFRNSSIKL